MERLQAILKRLYQDRSCTPFIITEATEVDGEVDTGGKMVDLTPDQISVLLEGATLARLEVLQGSVGGLIQPIYFQSDAANEMWTVYANEEGWTLAENPIASLLFSQKLVGPILIMGKQFDGD